MSQIMSCNFTDCGHDKAAGTTRAVIGIKRDRVLYDVSNICYVEGHIMPEETGVHQKHTVKDVAEAGNIDIVSRAMDVAVATLKEVLYQFTMHDIHDTVLDDKLKEPEFYGIVLDLPSGFSQTTLNLISRLAHKYIVNRVVSEWFAIAYPAKAEMWESRAEKCIDEIMRNINNRPGRIRRKLHPF